jgi:hypothetical protein
LAELLEVGAGWPVDIPPDMQSRSVFEVEDLPATIRHWPPSLQNLARALRAVRAVDLDTTTQAATNTTLFSGESRTPDGDPFPVGIGPRFRDMAGGQYSAEASKRQDPFAVSSARALNAVLSADPKVPGGRMELIATVLNAAYPRGYRTPQSLGGAREHAESWNPRTIERWVKSS